jgi:hypothetical protein
MRVCGSWLVSSRAAFLKPAVIGLFVCAALAQRPSGAESTAILERSRKAALEYVQSLPNFVCSEVIERYIAPSARGREYFTDWRLHDTLTVQLGYFEGKEEHKLTLIDGKPTDRTYDFLGGSIGSGEFGGMLHSVFDPASAATFRWERWRNVRRRRAAVYSYVVQQVHSSYLLVSRVPGGPRAALVGYHGEVEIVPETGAVLSLTYKADSIPDELRWTSAVTSVAYDFTDVGGRNYLLPASSETVMESPEEWTRNRMVFRKYGKFTSESSITFGDAR